MAATDLALDVTVQLSLFSRPSMADGDTWLPRPTCAEASGKCSSRIAIDWHTVTNIRGAAHGQFIMNALGHYPTSCVCCRIGANSRTVGRKHSMCRTVSLSASQAHLSAASEKASAHFLGGIFFMLKQYFTQRRLPQSGWTFSVFGQNSYSWGDGGMLLGDVFFCSQRVCFLFGLQIALNTTLAYLKCSHMPITPFQEFTRVKIRCFFLGTYAIAVVVHGTRGVLKT